MEIFLTRIINALLHVADVLITFICKIVIDTICRLFGITTTPRHRRMIVKALFWSTVIFLVIIGLANVNTYIARAIKFFNL